MRAVIQGSPKQLNLESQGDLESIELRVSGSLEGQGDLAASKLRLEITRVTIWFLCVINLPTKSPQPSKETAMQCTPYYEIPKPSGLGCKAWGS